MKVLFKIIKTNSGNDIYFKLLAQALRKSDVYVEIEYYPKILRYFPLLLKYFDTHKQADIVHTSAEYGWAFKKKATPLVMTIFHNVFDKNYLPYSSIFQKIYYHLILHRNIKKSLSFANKVIAISNYTKNSLVSTYKKTQIDVIYCGINTGFFKPKRNKEKNEKYQLLFVGNLTKRKGIDLLTKIATQLGKEFLLYYTTGLANKTYRFSRPSNMVSLGRLSPIQLVHMYNSVDCLIFPSRLEGFGYAVAEAMSCGLPVVCGNNSSLKELIKNGENGLLSKTNDAGDYVKNVLFLASHRTAAAMMSKKNRERIQQYFSLSYMANHYLKMYFSLLKNNI